MGRAMSYANVTDVQIRLGRPITSAAEIAQVTAWLTDVEALIKVRIPDLDQRVALGQIDEAIVALVEAQAVVRKVKNPDGKQNERIDDYSYGLNTDAARGDLFLTDEEWALLLPVSATGAFTIRPFGEPSSRVPHWWLR